MNNEKPSKIESPCIRQCCLDESDVCVGCFRTLGEILKWNSLSVIEKKVIISTCIDRKKQKKESR
ncbi:DUF1289 domain-containing protein [Pseudoalteromonas sp. MTN2-4]|uniref:DUF1289 domain-containing protein n=1 Tax=Pseudoalteromonas sp. MTN2-4 TaxID=3056555 RepID=UPI0036F28C51